MRRNAYGRLSLRDMRFAKASKLYIKGELT